MKKLNNKKGFTLAELLIVVAIIGVLTVVAVPIFTSQLEKSREAADIANMREAKAAAASAYLQDEKIGTKQLGSGQEDDQEVYFDASNGKLVESAPSVKYGKGTNAEPDSTNTLYGYEPGSAYGGKVIKITVKPNGDTELAWE